MPLNNRVRRSNAWIFLPGENAQTSSLSSPCNTSATLRILSLYTVSPAQFGFTRSVFDILLFADEGKLPFDLVSRSLQDHALV